MRFVFIAPKSKYFPNAQKGKACFVVFALRIGSPTLTRLSGFPGDGSESENGHELDLSLGELVVIGRP